MKLKHLASLLVGGITTAGTLGVAIPGCAGDKKACSVGTIECLDNRLARVCAPTGSEQTPQWIPFECEPGTVCQPGEPSGAGGGGAAPSGGACVGSCEDGASECVSDEISRYCLNGTSWQIRACDVGKACDPEDGTCKLSPDGVKICEPGTKACAADNVEKICDADGTMWIPVACGLHERCVNGACAPSPTATCDILGSGICLDATTSVRCLDITGGYEEVPCPSGTFCSGGRCIGSVCAVGSTCVALNQIRTCVDGVNQRDTQCQQGEVCVQHGDWAACERPTCTPGVTVCGDAQDLSVDPLTAYSRCVANTVTGLPEWQVTTCEGLLQCDPTALATTNPCRQQCTPGSEICANDPSAGVHQGWRQCAPDGTWGAIQSCNPNPGDLARVCANKPYQEAGTVNQVVCAQPVCADVWNNLAAVSSIQGEPLLQGVCDGHRIRPCDDDGNVAPAAQDCPTGICQIDGTVQADGLRRGACRDVLDPNLCQDGEEICVMDGVNPTPYYRTCESGVFSSALGRCPGDDSCFTAIASDGMRSKFCGGECAPGWTRCGGSGIQTCNASGTWGDSVACSVGYCQMVGSNEAKCVLDCLPDQLGCSGDSVRASDGIHTGTDTSMRCGADGRWPSFGEAGVTTCNVAGGQACRVSSRGEGLGCVQCIGPEVLGGNAQGVIDTRCDPSSTANVQECVAGNTWGPSSTCGSGTTCRGAQQVCGNCFYENGFTFGTCSNALIDNVAESCGTCWVYVNDGYQQVFPCSQGSLPATLIEGGSTPNTCDSLGMGPAGPWGVVADCCSGTDAFGAAFRTGMIATCETMGYGTPSLWAGVDDCCESFQQIVGSTSLAYCGPL
jgi:hypothetical protein